MVLQGSGAEQGWRLCENEEDFPGQGSRAVLETRDRLFKWEWQQCPLEIQLIRRSSSCQNCIQKTQKCVAPNETLSIWE